MKRRTFLGTIPALLASGCAPRGAPPLPPGELLGTRHPLGHRLRDASLPAPTEERRSEVVIVGAGIGGLSASWRLLRAGFTGFELIEMEAQPGGNSRWGENAVSAFPWGAHYVTLPSRESRAVRRLLADLGVLQGDPESAVPRYDERYLCFAPQERLYYRGSWHEGLVQPDRDGRHGRQEWQRFLGRMEVLRRARGSDGRRAFAVPMELSSRDPRWRALDTVSMRDWLHSEGYVEETVHWGVNYACRDDFGCSYDQVSAWAGIHYFAGRDGLAEHSDPEAVLTWPEGNGWIVRRMLERWPAPRTSNAMAFRLLPSRRGVSLDAYLPAEDRSVRIHARQVIWAAPLSLAARALGAGHDGLAAALRGFDQAAWLSANLTLSAVPQDRHGAPLAWDNVLHDSPSLGYVVATHQHRTGHTGPTVITYYLPLTEEAPAAARARLLNTSRESWADAILGELSRPHPEIRETCRHLDVFANGHAMVRPRPGLLWSPARQRAGQGLPNLHFAHADVSGMSLFEEANYRGVAAAEKVLRALGVRSESLL